MSPCSKVSELASAPYGHREAQWEWGMPSVNACSSTCSQGSIKWTIPPVFCFFIFKNTYLRELFWELNSIKYVVFNKDNQLFTSNMRIGLGLCQDSHSAFISHLLCIRHCAGHASLFPLICPSALALSPPGDLLCSYSVFCTWLTITWAGGNLE